MRLDKSLRALASNASLLGWLLPALGCLLAVGCQHGNQVRYDLYARELRLQEDEIYRLEDCLEECHEIIRGMRAENERLKQGTGASESVTPPVTPIKEDAPNERSLLDDSDWSPERPAPASDTPAPDVELPLIDGGEPAEAPPFTPPATAPAVEVPPAEVPAVEVPTVEVPGAASSATEAPPFDPSSADTGASSSAPADKPFSLDDILDSNAPASAPPASAPNQELLPVPKSDPPASEPSSLEMIPFGAAPADAGVRPASRLVPAGEGIAKVTIACQAGPSQPDGEATLLATVRPLAGDGKATLLQGEVQFVLQTAGEASAPGVELARWDYTAGEVSGSWIGMPSDPRLAFVLVMPPNMPAGEPIELWVQLLAENGTRPHARTAIRLRATESRSAEPKLTQAASEPIEPQPQPTSASGWTSRAPKTVTPAAHISEQGWHGQQAEQGSQIRVAGFAE